ncbi:hypothetical protein BU25DRAFT_348183, partial [Macroventuria anomochaeta]
SAKVSVGLEFGGPTHNDDEGEIEAATKGPVFTNNAPTRDVGFSSFGVPFQSFLPTPPSTEQLVHTFLRPPPHAFPHCVLSIQWVIDALGQSHFRFRWIDERYALTIDSSVRIGGVRLGLPPIYMEWLCGDEEESSPTEQSMLLIRIFFEEVRKEKEGSESG